VDHKACPEKCAQYRPHLEYVFDEILRRGVNSDGVIIGSLQNTPGPHDKVRIGDGWGSDFGTLGTGHWGPDIGDRPADIGDRPGTLGQWGQTRDMDIGDSLSVASGIFRP